MHRHSRRRFLGTLAATGLASLVTDRATGAQPGAARRIDIHHHFVSPTFLKTLTERNAKTTVPGLAAWKDYSPARALETLDRVGIQKAMLSITAPGVWFGDAVQARALAREMNEYAAARLVGDYKGRFGLFAVLPLPDVAGSLQEMRHANRRAFVRREEGCRQGNVADRASCNAQAGQLLHVQPLGRRRRRAGSGWRSPPEAAPAAGVASGSPGASTRSRASARPHGVARV